MQSGRLLFFAVLVLAGAQDVVLPFQTAGNKPSTIELTQ
jgi:hypothetical protein